MGENKFNIGRNTKKQKVFHLTKNPKTVLEQLPSKVIFNSLFLAAHFQYCKS